MEISDTKETIERASEASGAKKMLEELSQKMRAGKHGQGQTQGRPQSIEDFYGELPPPKGWGHPAALNLY